MSKLTGRLLQIAQQQALEELKSVDDLVDKRYAFWNEEDSQKQVERKLCSALVISHIHELWLLDTALGDDRCHIVGIDIESTGFNYWEHELLGVGFACMMTSDDNVHRCLAHQGGEEVESYFELFYVNVSLYPRENTELIDALAEMLLKHNDSTQWVLHNAKFDLHWIKQRFGLYLKYIDDSMVMAYVLGEPQKGIDKLAPIHLSRFPHTLSEHLGKDKIKPEDMYSIDVPWLASYCCEDALEGVLLSILFTQRLFAEETSHSQSGYHTLWNLYQKVDLFCVKALNWAEEVGVLIDWDKLSHVGGTLEAELFGIQCEIAELLNKPFSEAYKICQSPYELSNTLYHVLKLPTDKIKPTKFGHSTAVDALKELKDHHPLPKLILEYRKLAKVNGTYIKGFYERARKERLHTQFNNCLTDTGRLSSSNPNLQNIPNPALSPTGKLIRQCFVAGEGEVLVKADYSQFELRILAHFSQDPYLLDSYRSGRDVHSVVTCLLFDHEYEEFDPENNSIHKLERRLTKTINFGLIYGMTAHRLLSESRKANLDYTFAQCEELMEKYWSKLNGVAEWMAYVKLKALRDGYTETLFGRRRYFEFQHPYLKSLREKAKGLDLTLSNWKVLEAKGVLNHPQDMEAFRACGNAPIQGSNADAIRIVMGLLYERYYSSKVKLLLNVHDEIVLSCPWDEQERVKNELVELMVQVVKLSVPVEVEPKVATSWGDT